MENLLVRGLQADATRRSCVVVDGNHVRLDDLICGLEDQRTERLKVSPDVTICCLDGCLIGMHRLMADGQRQKGECAGSTYGCRYVAVRSAQRQRTKMDRTHKVPDVLCEIGHGGL